MARANLENTLYRWVKELPAELRLFDRSPKFLAAYNFEARQLLVPYFVTIFILARHQAWRHQYVSASFMASSFVVGIFEDFLNRDELCHCGPVCTFYAFAAGLAQIPALRYRSLASTAEESLSIIRSSLDELKDKWGSAVGALAALEEMKQLTQQHPNIGDAPEQQSHDLTPFFDDFGPELCRQYFLLEQRSSSPANLPNRTTDLSPGQLRPEHDLDSSVSILEQGLPNMNADSADAMLPPRGVSFFTDMDFAGTWMDDLGLGFPSC